MSAWWQTGVIYQIYPRSFQDSNGDGIGDIPGIIERLEYLSWLGIDAVWISPLYKSPMVDFGYDVADYCAIDPVFGSMTDFDRLLAGLHERGIRLIMDFVPNHTSVEHPWFKESRRSRENARRNWYVWSDGRADGAPPNNWTDATGKSAWTRDAATGQFYYHRFLPEQPDLNWRNPEVNAAMQRVLRFWLDRGVDGFRVDAATSLVEDALLRDEPDSPLPDTARRRVFTSDRSETHDIIAGIRETVNHYPDTVLIGERHLPLSRLMEYYGKHELGFQLPFNFLAISTPWTARSMEAAIDQYVQLLPSHSWPNWVLGNHDELRVATRVGPAQARVAAMLALTQWGTPFIYNGEELGAENIQLAPGQARDPVGRRGGKGRDGERGPLRWNREEHSGFTTGVPWLPLAPQRDGSMEEQKQVPGSMLQLYRTLIGLRKRELALKTGEFVPLRAGGDVLAYGRRHADSELYVALNFGQHRQQFALPEQGRVLASTHMDRDGEATERIELRADEGVVIRLGARGQR